ncbi:g820 [Coccomyxa viridis]|uniref:G820 protein n=1 Tax=Coccomyxa viridis TaxID=1274662 RepID=A0ABP1FKD1_9CHLO
MFSTCKLKVQWSSAGTKALAGQDPYLRAVSQTLPPPQLYTLPQQPQTAAAPLTISDVSSATSPSLLPRQPGVTPGYQALRTPTAAAPFSPSSSAISLPSIAAEDAYADPGEPSSSGGQGQARDAGISAEELAAMDPKRAKRLIANRQSAQRSKARKLRHIMQLEDEVQSLQSLTTQQQARLGALQQENALLGTSNQQLAMQGAELQSQVGSYEAFAEACLQELRRLSMLAGEPFQLPALPQPAPQEPQMVPQVPAAQFAAPDLALQQQLAAQARLPGVLPYPIMAQQSGLPQAQQPPGAYAGQPVGTPRMGAQRASGPVNLSSSYPPVYAQPMGRGSGLSQRGGRHQRVGSAGAMHPQGLPSGLAQGLSLEARQPSEPLPQRAGSGQIEGAEAGVGSDMPSASGSVQEAARQALAMAERHRMQAAGEQPQLDAGQAAIAAAEARRAAMSAEGRGQPVGSGQPLQRAMSHSIGREEAGRVAVQLPGTRLDPFRTIIPASAFRMEERVSIGGQDMPQTPGRRHGQAAQQLPAMPEQQAIMDMSQWPTGQPVGWPLGPRAQQPYPAVSVSSVGSVMQAFRGLDVHSSDPSGYALTPRGAFAPQHSRMQSQLPLLQASPTLCPTIQHLSSHSCPALPASWQGRYPNMSWDDMLRSLSDPIYQYDAQGNPTYSHQGLYPHAAQISRATFDMLYNPEPQQQPPGEEQQPPH